MDATAQSCSHQAGQARYAESTSAGDSLATVSYVQYMLWLVKPAGASGHVCQLTMNIDLHKPPEGAASWQRHANYSSVMKVVTLSAQGACYLLLEWVGRRACENK